jgi:hypothetical protein
MKHTLVAIHLVVALTMPRPSPFVDGVNVLMVASLTRHENGVRVRMMGSSNLVCDGLDFKARVEARLDAIAAYDAEMAAKANAEALAAVLTPLWYAPGGPGAAQAAHDFSIKASENKEL